MNVNVITNISYLQTLGSLFPTLSFSYHHKVYLLSIAHIYNVNTKELSDPPESSECEHLSTEEPASDNEKATS